MSILELDQDTPWRRGSSGSSGLPLAGMASETQAPSRVTSRSNPRPGRLAVYGPVGLHKFITGAFPTYSPQVLAAMPIDVYELVPRLGRWSGAGSERRRGVDGIGTLTHVLPDESGAYTLVSDDTHTVRAGPISHSVPCYGYAVTELEKSHLDVDALLALGVPPGRVYGELKLGRPIVSPSGKVITPEDVTIRGDVAQRVVILGDNCDASGMLPLAAGADLVVHEATLLPGLERIARQRGHSTAAMAGAFARRCGAKSLVLTHFGNGLCSTFEEAAMNSLGRRDLEEAIRSALTASARLREDGRPASSSMSGCDCPTSPPLAGQLLGYWGGILETQRRLSSGSPAPALSSSRPTTTVLENYDSWLRSRERRVGELEIVDLVRHSFPECRSSTSLDSVTVENAAVAAFGKPAVLLARDHMAVVLPRIPQGRSLMPQASQNSAAGPTP